MAPPTREQFLEAARQRGMSVSGDVDKEPSQEDFLAAAKQRGIKPGIPPATVSRAFPPGYVPTREEYVESIRRKSKEGPPPQFFHGGIRGALGGAEVGALQGVVDIGRGAAEIPVGALNLISKYLGHPTDIQVPDIDVFQGPLANLKGTLPAEMGALIPQLVGAVGTGAALAPSIARGAIRAAPALARYTRALPLLASTLGAGVAGGALQPGGLKGRGKAAAEAALSVPVGTVVGKGLKKVATSKAAMKLAKKAEKVIGRRATKTLKGWLGGVERGEAPKEILEEVKRNYDKVSKKYGGLRGKEGEVLEKGLFDKHQDIARKSGYIDNPISHPKPSPPSRLILPPGVVPPVPKKAALKEGAKMIAPEKSKKLLKKVLSGSGYSDKGLKKVVKKYIQQPSFKHAHEAQSYIGKEAHLYEDALTAGDRETRSTLKATKKAVLEDIKSGMEKNLDKGLHQDYLKIREGYRKEVTPYSEHSGIRNARKGKSAVKNIKGSLVSGHPAAEKVLSDLSPRVRRQLMASHLKEGLFERGAKGELKINPEKLIKGYEGLAEKEVGRLKDPTTHKNIETLRKLLGQMEPLESRAAQIEKIKKYLPYAALLALGWEGRHAAKALTGG